MINAVVCIIVVLLACAEWGLLMYFIGAIVQLVRERIGMAKTRTPKEKTHIDMMTKEVKMSEIKAGDRVRCISGIEDVGLPSYPKRGTVGTVLNVGNDEFALVQWPIGTVPLTQEGVPVWYAALHRLEKAESFNPGDKVVVIEESGFTPPKGVIGTVVSTTGDGAWISWPNGHTVWCLNVRVELVETPDEATKTQKQTGCENSNQENELPFAPGDKVRYTADGTVGEVVRSDVDGTTLVRWPKVTVLFNSVDAAHELWANNENLELVRDEIHVGDIVRLKNTKETLAFHEEHPSWYPKQSVVGRVVGIEQDMARVEWEAGSVERNSSGGFAWYIAQKRLDVVFAKK